MNDWATSTSPPPTGVLADADMLTDDDAQLALWVLYELHYLGFDDVDPALEWEPGLLALRRDLERRLETRLREGTGAVVDDAAAAPGDLAEAIFDMCAGDETASVVSYVHHGADEDQLLELLMHRSVYQLKEADPQTWMLPRLRGRAKTALLEIQYDEYGGGRVEDVHQTLFANSLSACGLDPTYGAYVDDAPGTTLAFSNVASMFGLHRRLRGAAVGFYAALEATSSIPCRRMSAAMRRLGFGADARRFYDEHVEADAVHEQLAARELCGSLVQDHPTLYRDVLFGAAAYLCVEGVLAESLLTSWRRGSTSLYRDAASQQPVATADARSAAT